VQNELPNSPSGAALPDPARLMRLRVLVVRDVDDSLDESSLLTPILFLLLLIIPFGGIALSGGDVTRLRLPQESPFGDYGKPAVLDLSFLRLILSCYSASFLLELVCDGA
jgi:hypothetical protein